jgi:uncharacterized membrane protein YgaE (UPF0421/DUF939 family)
MLNLGRYFTVVGIASAILMVLAVLQLTLYTRLDYQLQELERKYKDIVSRNQHFELEVNRSGDLNKVSQAATQRFNMVFPQQIVYLHAKN